MAHGRMTKFHPNAFALFLSNFVIRNPMLTNLLLSALTSGGEQLLENHAFKCPKEGYKHMGLIFLLGPPTMILLITLVLNKKYWFLYHGCCLDKPNVGKTTDEAKKKKEPERTLLHSPIPDAFTVKMYDDQVAYKDFSIFFTFVFRAMLLPAVWIVTALFDGDFMVCHCLGEREEDEETFRVKENSRFIAWILLLTITILGISIMCYIRCCDKNTFLENLYKETYWQILQTETIPKTKKKASKDAKALALKIAVENLDNVEKKADDGVQEPNEGKKKSNDGEKKPKNGLFSSLKKSKLLASKEVKSPEVPISLQDISAPMEAQYDTETPQPGPSGVSIQQHGDGATNDRDAFSV